VRAPDVAQTAVFGPHFPAVSDILGHPLPHLNLGDRLLLRALALLARRQILSVHGLQHVRAAADPFILAVNHNTRYESLLVPAVLFLHRGGRIMHFLADWNFRLIPGIGYIYSRAQVVTVTRKSAKPRVLNVLRPLYRGPLPPLERARRYLASGRSIGIFPEGQVNRDADRLLRGRRGAARLSLETGAPVVPMGIRFPHLEPGHRIQDHAAMELWIGAPLVPPAPAHEPVSLDMVTDWHAAIMGEIARLSGKQWTARTKEANHDRA
jgi:1-acyl-sn-glycerol-3-phosphate acyltransferase